MLINYIRITVRNIFRSKLLSSLNIMGIAIGMAAAILILFYILFETSFDTFHSNAERIYRIEVDTYRDGILEGSSSLTPSAVAPALRDNFPEVENFTRIASNPGKTILVFDDKSIQEEKAYLVDPSLFDVFTITFLSGNRDNILADSHDLIISENLAQKIWGSDWEKNFSAQESVALRSQGLYGNFTIRGVFKNFPANSHFRPEILAAKSFITKLVGDEVSDENWDFNFFYAYIKVSEKADTKSMQSKFNDFVAKTRKEALALSGVTLGFHFRPLTDIHLKSNIQFELEPNGDINTVNALGLVGLVILIIAWVNFINLSTARSIKRAKEVGVRKVLGAAKRQLIYQFILEAFLINTIGLAVAVLLVSISTSAFSELTEIPAAHMRWMLLISNTPWMIAITSVFLTGIVLSGLYPAFVISNFNPIKALKGSIPKPGGFTLRRALVVFQFCTSLILVSATIIIHRQIDFMRTSSLGVNISRTLVVEAPENLDAVQEGARSAFKQRVLTLPKVEGFTMSSVVPGQEVGFRSYNLASDKTSRQINCGIIGIDADFIDNYGLTLLAGHDFTTLNSDPAKVILNEEAAHQLGFVHVEDAIGTKIIHHVQNRKEEFFVDGVVKNYHHRSLRSSYEPILFRYGQGRDYYSIVLAPQGWKEIQNSLQVLKDQFAAYFPDNPFVFFFLDQQFDSQYRADMKFGNVFLAFSSLALTVAMLGLLGLSTFIINLRTFEIGIRKVFGASRPTITMLLCKDYLVLLLIATLIGTPIIWTAAQTWLNAYSFRIKIELVLILIPILAVALITALTVGLQAFLASSKKPIDTLRAE